MQTKEFVDAMKKQHAKQLAIRRSDVEDCENVYKEYEEYLADKKEALEHAQRKLQKLMDAAEDDTILTQKAEQFLTQIRRHTCIESVRIEDGALFARTRLLFADIRKAEGNPATVRTCLGAYDIQIVLGNNRISITNLLYSQPRAHWAVNNGVPCFGTWEPEVVQYQRAQDYYRLIDLLTVYLRDAENDMGAYMRSHAWRQARMIAPQAPLQAGDFVVISYPDTSYLGRVAVVTSVATGSCGVLEKDTGSNYRLEPFYLHKISPARYQKGRIAAQKMSRYTTTSIPAELDKLPEGTKLADAQALLSKKNHGKAKATH